MVTHFFLPGKSHGHRSLAGCNPWGRESWTQLSGQTTTAATYIVSLYLFILYLEFCTFSPPSLISPTTSQSPLLATKHLASFSVSADVWISNTYEIVQDLLLSV